MTTKSTNILEPTLADAFEVGRREGLKEAFSEIEKMVGLSETALTMYVRARLKSIHDFEVKNPFKQGENT